MIADADKTSNEVVELVEFIRRIADQKRRQSAASEAGRRARQAIKDREQFVPKQTAPRDGVGLHF